MNDPRAHLNSETLQAFLEGELAANKAGEVESHLATCRRCASEMDAWRLLFTELGSLEEIAPPDDFQMRVMSAVPTRPPLAQRLSEKLRAAIGSSRSATRHVDPERIQDLLDGMLPARGRHKVARHLESCAHCREAVGEWEPVFAMLRSVPRLEPSPGFAARVMAAVEPSRVAARSGATATATRAPTRDDRVAEWAGRAAALGGRLIPSTGRGWAWLAAAVSLPTLGMLAVVGAVVAHPLLTIEGLLTFMRWRVGDGIQLAAAWTTERMFQSSVTAWLWELGTTITAAPALALLGFVVLWTIALSAGWILYRNVFAPSQLAGRHG